MNSVDAREDRKIVADVLNGQPAKFDVLVRRYQQPLFQLALSRLGKIHLADEAVQETFLAAFRYLPSYQPKYSFRTWLWTILLNQCKQSWTRWERQHQQVPISENDREEITRVADPGVSPSERAEQIEEIERLHTWFAELPDTEADALRLRFFAQFKFQEIAEAQGCSLATAKNRVRRGLETLGKKLASDSTTFV